MIKRTPAYTLCVLIQLLLACLSAGAQTTGLKPQPNEASFGQLVDRYFDFYFQTNPTAATQTGFHQYDTKLEDYSRSAVEAEVTGLTKFRKEFGKVQRSTLNEISAGDLDVLTSTIDSRLLELQTIQMWKKDPDTYPSSVSYSIFLVMRRNFAPLDQRLRSVIARERQIPQALEAARQNLHDPPRVYTEVALQQLPDTIKFFQNDVPSVFREVKDAKLQSEFKTNNDSVVKALKTYRKFLQEVLLPASHGDFRLGAENFSKKLLYDEMIDIPLDHMLEVGYADLRRNQAQLKTLCAQMDPHRSPAEILADLRKDHPPADQLMQTFRDTLGGLRQFIEQKKIITLPSKVPPIVEETPPFQRALTTAAMDTPGAYETKATEAMFYVTLPEPGWKPEKVEEWMQGFNHGTIASTAIHEVYPGHYTQFLWLQARLGRVT